MTTTESTDKAPPPLFRVKVGHVLLAGATAIMILSLAIWSIFSMQVHEAEKNAIFAEETDSSALTFVQRESFGILIKLEQWANGQGTARDVQISRAMLGQRLGVETDSGTTTYEITSADYQAALSKLDVEIKALGEAPDGQRMSVRQKIDPVISKFSEQTRALSETFQTVTRDRVRASANERANSEFIQAMILIAILVFSAILSSWITFDIVKGFRRASKEISQKQRRLDESLGRLLLVQNMDERSRELIQEVQEGAKAQDLVPKLKKILGELIPGSELVVEMAGNEVIKFELANPPELNISKRDFDFLRDRALEVLSTSLLHDQQKQDINFAQQHDTVTGLANRSAFNAVLESKAATVNLQGGVLGLYYLDIDRFGDLNSSLGYQMGDLVLLNMGFRISDTLRSSEFAARLASDEFAIVGIYKNETEARSRALELQAHFNFEMDLNDAKAAITVSMGCAISHSAQADVTDLPRCAALAIHLAKKLDRRSSFVTYNSDDHSHLMNTWQDEIAVRNALATGEFKVYFQPIVSLSTRNIVGFEALIRWQRPGLGIIYPDQFLPLVNSAGLTVAVGADVFVESIRAWKKVLQPACAELGLQDPYISINMEALQLQDESFVQFVLSEIDHAEIPHGNVQLEVTEHALVGGEKVTARLEQFRATGIRIALDDFGTGYSNLAQTLKLPLDVLKLDKSLLLNVEEEEKSLRMIEDIVQLAHGQDFAVIAEGVESERIAGLLARIEVDRGQGYLFGRAMAADQIHSWVHKHGLGQHGV